MQFGSAKLVNKQAHPSHASSIHILFIPYVPEHYYKSPFLIPMMSRSATCSSRRWKLCEFFITISRLRGRRRERGDSSPPAPPAPPSPPVHTPESLDTADPAPGPMEWGFDRQLVNLKKYTKYSDWLQCSCSVR